MSFYSNLLRVTFIAGLLLFALTGAALTGLFFAERSLNGIFRQEDSFSRLLRVYDISAQAAETKKDFENLVRELNRIEKRTVSVETWLSILKRRRVLINLYPPSAESYNDSIQQALKAYPSAQPIIAFAAAAVVKDRAINNQTGGLLRSWLPLLTDAAFNTLRLSLHVLLGDFSSPEKAALIPGELSPMENENIIVNLAILKILQNDLRTAAAGIQSLLHSPAMPLDDSIRFAAEYHYDFGDILRSAQLFSRLEDDSAIFRQADALYLAGYIDSARSLWTLLAEGFLLNESPKEVFAEQSLYNLALTADNDEEKIYFFERLAIIEPVFGTIARQAGLIQYSRLLNDDKAIAVLENSAGIYQTPLLDLELCRRRTLLQEPGRQAAETWLLLDRHCDTSSDSFQRNQSLYLWAAWKLYSLRNYDETRILINRMQNMEYHMSWADEYTAIQLMYEGSLEAAANILRSIPDEKAEWHVYANLGRIYEMYRSPIRALELYKLAAIKVNDPISASRIQYRIAGCSSALGNFSEALHSLQLAVGFDPENLAAQFEIDRMIMP